MISGWTEEHDELRDVARRFLADKSSSDAVRLSAAGGAAGDDAVWRQMADQIGLQGIAVPAEYGGAGMGPVELGVVLEEMGRRLYIGPYLSTVALAGQTLTSCEDESARARWLPGIADGSLRAAVGISDRDFTFGTSALTTTAREVAGEAGTAWKVTGTKAFVIDGATADLLLVAARVGDEVGLFGVDASEPGISRESLPTVDITRAVARVELDDVSATRIGGDATEVLRRAGELAAAALAAEQIGGAAAALEMAVEYSKIRVQFDRPIGSFQALKHRCADLLIAVESGRSAAFFAAVLLAEEDPEGSVAASVAQAWCSDTYSQASRENVQIHGGIGYTWECDAHLHLRRAAASHVVLGSPASHRARIADLVGM
jgi:alkylation response protein AidB-like acyl-CoA dehydrogenase